MFSYQYWKWNINFKSGFHNIVLVHAGCFAFLYKLINLLHSFIDHSCTFNFKDANANQWRQNIFKNRESSLLGCFELCYSRLSHLCKSCQNPCSRRNIHANRKSVDTYLWVFIQNQISMKPIPSWGKCIARQIIWLKL